MNDRKVLVVENRFQGRERRMQSEEPIEVDCGFFHAPAWFGNRNLRTQIVIMTITERHHHRDTIRGASLKDRDHDGMFFGAPSILLSQRRAHQERRHGRITRQGESGGFQKITTRNCHVYLIWNSGEPIRLTMEFIGSWKLTVVPGMWPAVSATAKFNLSRTAPVPSQWSLRSGYPVGGWH